MELAGLQDPTVWEQVRGGLFGMWTSGVESAAVLDYVASMAEYGCPLALVQVYWMR